MSDAAIDKGMRTRILDGASRLLVDVGYANLSMRRLAESIGYSATTIYHHFENKDDLFHALVAEGMGRLHHVLSRASKDNHEGVERLEALCRAYVDFATENPEYYDIMFLQKPAAVGRFPVDMYREARRNLDLFARAIATICDGAATDDDAQAQATAVWAMLHGAVALVNAGRTDKRIAPADLVDRVVEAAVSSCTETAHASG